MGNVRNLVLTENYAACRKAFRMIKGIVIQPQRAPNTTDSVPLPAIQPVDSPYKLCDREIHLPVEIWLQVLSLTDTRAIRSVSQACSALRLIAQPLLFKLFVISSPPPPIFAQTLRRDRYSATRARLGVLSSPLHLAYAIEELRIWQPTASQTSPCSSNLTSPQANEIITIVFTAIPSLNIRRLVLHDILFTSERLKALSHLSQLTDLQLHSCWTTCPSSSFPDFSVIPLETLTVDYSYFPTTFFHTATFLFISLLLQPPTLKHVSAGPASEIINAIENLPAGLANLTRLEIPPSSLSSPLLLSALTSCPSVTELVLRTEPGPILLPPLSTDFLPADILPLLNTYRGPRMYASVFVHGHTLSCIDFTLSCKSNELMSTLLSFDIDSSCTAYIRTFSCKVHNLNTEAFQAIHTAFPALTNLTISGGAMDVHALGSMLFDVEEGVVVRRIKGRKEGLKSIQLCVKMGLPRLTVRWRTIGARMFLDRLVDAYPNLQTVRLVCHPDQMVVVWQRPLETHLDGEGWTGLEFGGAEQWWVEKQEGPGGGGGGAGGFWETVKKKW